MDKQFESIISITTASSYGFSVMLVLGSFFTFIDNNADTIRNLSLFIGLFLGPSSFMLTWYYYNKRIENFRNEIKKLKDELLSYSDIEE